MGLTDGDGYTLARIARALAIARGSVPQARAYCEAQHGVMALATRILQKAGTVDIPALGDDAEAAAASQAFITLARAHSLIESINAVSAFSTVPFVLPFLVEGEGAVAFWTHEGKPIKTSRESFTTMRLPALKLASLIVLTNEVLRLLGPAGDSALNRALQRAANKTEAQAFIDPANAGVAGESPASITHGAPSTPATGNTAADIRALIDAFEGDLASAVFVMGAATAVSFALAGATLGAADIGVAQVGTLAGIPAIAHSAVPADALVLLDPSRIALTPRLFASDASSEASLEVDDGTGTTVLMSLWQENLSSVRLLEYVNWFASDGAVSVLTGIGTVPLGTSKGAKA
ncbi:phage major capsid protein [Paraburkholderia sp. Cpub6]|uniref:phage major capsid protein n=1 Tax=Paraburkholderia sp. Cpub6 TaxID=2723094 RepID=UPI00161FBAA1|nr:phage major capsid protein [Paraburkholderia sp. Cpub6]MBB5456897.1 HK97 family phage major capsid protein [Paraburkholderia sp. Cpub6]